MNRELVNEYAKAFAHAIANIYEEKENRQEVPYYSIDDLKANPSEHLMAIFLGYYIFYIAIIKEEDHITNFIGIVNKLLISYLLSGESDSGEADGNEED